jgi:hypothetical protein
MEPQETKEVIPLLVDAANFLRFAKTVDKVVNENRPTCLPESVQSLLRAVETGNFPIVNFAVTECRRAGVTFKDMELYCRKTNAKCWFVATEPPKVESKMQLFSFAPNEPTPEYQIMISTHNAYAVFSSFFANEPKKYFENFNQLNKCGFLQVQSADVPPHNMTYEAIKFAK